MAREVSILKKAKISKAQQYMLLSVLGMAVLLGATISLVQHFVQRISFNTKVIMEEEQTIVSYSDAIKNIGICKKPKGSVYDLEEIRKCDPDTVDVSSVPGTLRANIIENMAANEDLNSVPKENTRDCINPTTGKNYTYKEMNALYDAAETQDEFNAATALIQRCSALRIIPDALPAYKNEEALLASLNRIFLLSNWEPESLSPAGTADVSPIGTNLNTFAVRLSVEASTGTTMNVLSNIEKSIREFNIERATIEWGGSDTLVLQAQATAYYMDRSELGETKKTVKVGDVK